MNRRFVGLLLLLILLVGGNAATSAAAEATSIGGRSGETSARRSTAPTYAPASNYLVLIADGPVDVLVTDPQGRRVGVNPASGQVVLEIPGIYYYGPHEVFEGLETEGISIPAPLSGTYSIQVTGTGEDWFNLVAMEGASWQGELLLHDTGNISLGQVIEYTVPGEPRPLSERAVTYILPLLETGEWESVLHLQSPGLVPDRVMVTVYDSRGIEDLFASLDKAITSQGALSMVEILFLRRDFYGSATAESRGGQRTALVQTAESTGLRRMATEGIAGNTGVLYVPHVSTAQLSSTLYLENVGDEPADVRVTYYEEDGTIVPGAALTLTLSSRAITWLTSDAGLPEGFQGSAVLESLNDQPLVGAVFLGDPAGRAALYSVADRPAAVLFVPQVLKGSAGLTTTLQIQNTTATTTTVAVRYYDAAGRPLTAAETRLILSPHGAAQVVVGENSALPAGFSGAAVLQSLDGAPLTAVALVQGGPGNDTLGATSTLYGGSPTLALPYLDTTTGQTPAVQVQNLGSEVTTATLRCYDPAGTPAYTATTAVAPYGYAAFVTATLPLTPGVYAAVVESGSDQPLAAFVRQQGITEGLSLYGGSAAGAFVVPPVSFAAAPAATRTASFSVTLTTNAPPAEIVSTTLWVRTPLTTTWANSGLVLTTTSGALAYTPTAGDGTYSFAAVARDAAGYREAEPAGPGDSATLYDTTAPTSSATAPTYANSAAITVTFAAADAGIGVGETILWVRPPLTTTWATTALVLTGTSGAFVYTPTAGDGPYFFAARSTDQLGNWEAEPTGAGDTMTIYDRAAPASTAVAPAYANAVPITVTFVASDTVSGVAYTELWARTPPTTTWVTSGLVLTGTSGAFVYTPTAGDGPYFFATVAVDNAGNHEAEPVDDGDTATVYDTVPPSSTVAALPPYRTRTFTVTWAGSDATAGIATYDVQYRIDAGDWQEWLAGVTMTQALFEGDQEESTYYFACRASDRAGNVEDWPEDPDYDTWTVLELTPPASSASAPDYDTGGAIPVSWTAADKPAGVASTELWVRPPPTTTWAASGLVLTGTSGTFAYTPTVGDGTYFFGTVAEDWAGNREAGPTGPGDDSTVYDTTPPASQVEALPAYRLATFTVTWSGSDATSGLQDYDVQVCTVDCISGWSDWLTQTTTTTHTFTGSHGVTYSFRSRARDVAGNVEDWPASADTATTVDTAPPETAVDARPAYYTTTTFPVSWQGADALSGLHHYNLYYRAESAVNWTLWLENVTYTQTTFTGIRGYTYHFCSQGVDNLGNAEGSPLNSSTANWPIVSDANTGVTPWSRVDDLPAYTGSRTFTVAWSGGPPQPGQGAPLYNVQVRDGGYGAWTNWLTNTPLTAAQFTGQYGHIYYFRCQQQAWGRWELYPLGYDTYTKLVAPAEGEGAAGGGGVLVQLPPDEAPDRMEEVTRTQSLGTLTGYIAPADDVDWYRFELTATKRLRVTLADLPADFDVYVFDGSGQFLWASTWGRQLPEEVVVRVPAGVYYVQLVGYAGDWSGEEPYRLTVEVASGGHGGGGGMNTPAGTPVPW